MRAIRALFGFILGCLAAAATFVLFVYTPAELGSLPPDMAGDRLSEAARFALAVTPHIMLFAALPALIGIVFAERNDLAGLPFYLLLGVAVAVLGFLTQHFSEAPGQPTILRNYALTAFLTTGAVSGFFYWLVSGRYVAPRRLIASPVEKPPPANPGADAGGPVARTHGR